MVWEQGAVEGLEEACVVFLPSALSWAAHLVPSAQRGLRLPQTEEVEMVSQLSAGLAAFPCAVP